MACGCVQYREVSQSLSHTQIHTRTNTAGTHEDVVDARVAEGCGEVDAEADVFNVAQERQNGLTQLKKNRTKQQTPA